MMRWLRACLIFARVAAFPRVAPKWEQTDAVALTHFLSTPSGVKFRMITDQMCANNNSRAVQRASQWDCGVAVGFSASRAMLLSLTDSGPTPETTEDQTQGADNLDHLVP